MFQETNDKYNGEKKEWLLLAGGCETNRGLARINTD